MSGLSGASRGDLPAGWEWQELAAFCSVTMGSSPKSATFTDSANVGTPFLQGNAEFGERHPIPRKGTTDPLRLAPAGSVLVSVRAPVGAVNITNEEVCIGRGLAALTPNRPEDIPFLFWAMQAQRIALNARATGTTFPAVTGPALKTLPIPVPPTDVRGQIVAAIEDAFARIDSVDAELNQVVPLIERLRRAGSRDAFAFDEGCPVRDLSEVATVQSGITKNSKVPADASEVPYLSTANVQAGYLDLEIVKTIHASPAQRKRHALQEGDVLVLEGGDPDKVGRGWVWEGSIADCLHQNHVYAVRVDPSQLLPRFLAHYINSPPARAAFLARAKQTTGIASINKTQLQSLPVPVPDIAVQGAVVAELEALDARAGSLARMATDTQTALSAMRQSVLYAALTGTPLSEVRELPAVAA